MLKTIAYRVCLIFQGTFTLGSRCPLTLKKKCLAWLFGAWSSPVEKCWLELRDFSMPWRLNSHLAPHIKPTLSHILSSSGAWWILRVIGLSWCRSWRNNYRLVKWTRGLKLKFWTKLFALQITLIPFEKIWIHLFSFQQWINSRTDWVSQPWYGNQSRRRKAELKPLVDSERDRIQRAKTGQDVLHK